MAQETIDQVTDQELFNEASSDPAKPELSQEQTQNTSEEPTKAPVEAKEARVRDDKGRFASADPEASQEVVAEETAQPEAEPEPQTEKQVHRVPLVELLDEREKRQTEQRQREALQQQLWQLQQQLQEATKKPEEPVDIFADPQKWEQTNEQRFDKRIREMEGNFSLRLAAYKHGDKFQEAWSAMLGKTQSGDDSVRQSILKSSDPGETLVNWYQREKTMELVGNDPTTFVERTLEEALNNPEFLAKALEKAKSQASTRPTQVKLPQSLNKATGSGSSDSQSDMSDSALFDYSMR